jgi:phosphate transport system permease protein
LKVFFTGTFWNSVEGRESFGALSYIIGALVSQAIEIVIGVPVSLGIAIFGSELPSPKISTPLSFVIEVLAAVQV